MIHTSNFKKMSRSATTLGAALLVSGLTLGSTMALAASNDGTRTTNDGTMAPSKTASHAGRAVSDSWITTKVKSEIMANSASKALKVSVKTTRGAVSLKGKLPSQDAIDMVKAIAEKVKGVKSVDVTGLMVAS